MQKEAKARIKINNLLQNAGWRFFEDKIGKANIVLENNTKITKQAVDEFGNDFEKTKKGFIDFVGSDAHHQNHIDAFSKRLLYQPQPQLKEAIANNQFFRF